MRALQAAVFAAMVAATALTFAPQVGASACTGGAALVHCNFSCTAGRYFSVSVTGPVGASVKGQCGGAEAVCTVTGTNTFCSRASSSAPWYSSSGVCWVNSFQTALVSCSG